LWSKPLPSGHRFDLDVTTPSEYLHHSSDLGEFFLSSDSVIPTYDYWESTADLIGQLPVSEVEDFVAVGYTVGGMMVCPQQRGRRQVDHQHGAWDDPGHCRPDGPDSPVHPPVLRRRLQHPTGGGPGRYEQFFRLFGRFRGYVDSFLLQDLVDPDDSVRLFIDFDNFESSGVPTDVATYGRYREASIRFVCARNERIAKWASAKLVT
jgi:hypothetical protein